MTKHKQPKIVKNKYGDELVMLAHIRVPLDVYYKLESDAHSQHIAKSARVMQIVTEHYNNKGE